MRSLSTYARPLTLAIGAVALLAAPPAARADSTLADLVDAAAQRLQVADDVAAIKWQTGGAIEDPARVDQQLAKLATEAAGKDLDPDYVRRIFADQIAATEAAEHYRFSQWKLDPATAPSTAPELVASRARIDGFNQVMLAQIGQRWGLLHSADCAGQLDEATRAVSEARQLDEFYRRALASATQDYCAR
ncbi:chorismate mutase [[Mycobacterium] holstebronense]|uniref:Chorismate mutase n=1 Tax=[Mycobacterium] holstebronense TaxID=3064288 RepID=A0ABN9MZB1_9MYCO|nr:chorismate mutase [Mycolicibacter sp. MU0102]CAJ1497330.1 chorismate mutase [Mycolicibacter sp. MU0102]